MKPKISILVGSGFSIPEGLPGVKQINQRLYKIKENEILIHTDQTALFLNGQTDLNGWSSRTDRIFLQEFLEFYNSDILKSTEEFHYETFYDYYSLYLTNNKHKNEIEAFYKKYNSKYFTLTKNHTDCYNMVSNFNRSYNQLLASQLHKTCYFKDVGFSNYPPYDAFIEFLSESLETNDIKFHTLNHDLFFDWIGKHHSKLNQHFSDGYQLAGSPFYGEVRYDFNQGAKNHVSKTYYVKLERFVNKFSTALSLYKLHGSINNKIIYTQGNNQEITRIKDNYAVSSFLQEFTDPQNGEQKFEYLLDEVAPDFLSGTTNKTRFYTSDPYYQNLFKHFEDNLLTSELLIVIGYGFQDSGVNEYLEKHFLSRGKHMIVIDPRKPDTNLLEKYSATYISKGVTQISYNEYKELVSNKL